MSINRDFYGRSGFVWFTGVVEDRDDPMKLGSVRVRVIGLHSDDKSLVPTSSLPWAQVLQSPGNASTTSGPREGDWVFGFFQDGDHAQIPVVIGVFPGIESKQSQTIYKTVQVQKGADNMPKPSQFDRAVGEQTTPRMSRGVMPGTLTNTLNSKLAKACDINEQVKAGVVWARLKNSTIMKAITAQLKALTLAKGKDPSGLIKMATDVLKKIQTYLRWLQEILQDIQDWAYVGIEYAKMARAAFDFVMSLPSRLQRFLQDCLRKVVAGIMAVVTELFNTSEIDSGLGEFKAELQKTADQFQNTYRETLETVSLPGQFIDALLNPSSAADQAKVEGMMVDIIDGNTKNAEDIHGNIVSNSTVRNTP